MANSAQQAMLGTFFADFAFPDEIRRRTKEAIVMQRLNHRQARLAACLEDRRRDHHERVVYVHDVRPVLAK